MGADLDFDANKVKPSSPNEPIPADWYTMAIVASERKQTNDRKGSYLVLEHQVLDGEYKGRKVWVQLNLVNDNPDTVRISQEQLSAVCHATGVLKPINSSLFHNIPMSCKVTIPQPKKGYEPKNDIKGWKAIAAGAAPVAGAPATAAPTAAPTTAPVANAPAWARKAG